jgi:hypothetical protein
MPGDFEIRRIIDAMSESELELMLADGKWLNLKVKLAVERALDRLNRRRELAKEKIA